MLQAAMADQPGREHEALRQTVSEVLHYIRDPVGVAGAPQARDEYDGYVDYVCPLLWQGVDTCLVAKHLQMADRQPGLTDTRSRADLAAENCWSGDEGKGLTTHSSGIELRL